MNVPSDASGHPQDMNDPDGVAPHPAELIIAGGPRGEGCWPST